MFSLTKYHNSPLLPCVHRAALRFGTVWLWVLGLLMLYIITSRHGRQPPDAYVKYLLLALPGLGALALAWMIEWYRSIRR